MILREKVILIISPQPWSEMYISKHHYAIELAKRGNQVYFLNPISKKMGINAEVKPHQSIDNLWLINYQCILPYRIKFHWMWLYNIFHNLALNKVTSLVSQAIDIVWDFDCGNIIRSYSVFNSKLNIFHPVDYASDDLDPKKKPHIIISVSNKILSRYQNLDIPKILINHGLGEIYTRNGQNILNSENSRDKKDTIVAAYVGNLMIPFICHESILSIVNTNRNIAFHLIGPYSINGEQYHVNSLDFIRTLSVQSNVHLHGLKSAKEIIEIYKNVDIFFYCYCNSENYKGDNSHKLMEFLSTGKIVVGSPLLEYQNLSLHNVAEPGTPWITLFNRTVNSLKNENARGLQIKRIEFALSHSYDKLVSKIESEIMAMKYGERY
jgi:glycosyltransferase involved in cell wall biosynthesis